MNCFSLTIFTKVNLILCSRNYTNDTTCYCRCRVLW